MADAMSPMGWASGRSTVAPWCRDEIDTAPVIDVWLAFHDRLEAAALAQFDSLLSAQEHARVQRLRVAADRRCMRAARGLVRSVLSRYAPVLPREWTFAVDAHGRPRVDECHAEARGLSFNLSHTRGLIALAVCRGRDVGVDVECVPDRPIAPGFEQRYFCADETAALARCGEPGRQARMLEYWTLKEAYLKARGLGLSVPLDAFGFRLDGDGGIGLQAQRAFDEDPGRWEFWQYRPSARHVLALCTARSAPPVHRVAVRSVTSVDDFSELAMVPTARSKPGGGRAD